MAFHENLTCLFRAQATLQSILCARLFFHLKVVGDGVDSLKAIDVSSRGGYGRWVNFLHIYSYKVPQWRITYAITDDQGAPEVSNIAYVTSDSYLR